MIPSKLHFLLKKKKKLKKFKNNEKEGANTAEWT